MGFLVGIIVNTVLLSIPIGATLGALFGIRPFEDQRKAIILPQNNFIITSSCEEFHFFAENKNGQNFTINSNEILPEDNSNLCGTITTRQNSTYPSNSTAPPFQITWSYPFRLAPSNLPANFSQTDHPLIHAFPQATIATLDPVSLVQLEGLELGFSWSMGTGNTPAPETSQIRLGASEVNATVALDMYLDNDPTLAGNASAAAFEMIIYFAKFGLEDPVGFGNGSIISTGSVDGVNFNLFTGKNSNDQNVFSWVATQPVTSFDADIMPLFTDIVALANSKKNLTVDFPTPDTFLGYAGFGTQAYNSDGNVTFALPKLLIDVRRFSEE